MLRTIPYFLKGTAEEWFENLAALFNDWDAFKAAFLEQFTDNNTSITLRNWFHNIKQESSESVITYLGKFNKLLRRICQLKTNDYYSNTQILDQFIVGLKDKLIKKVYPHVSEDLNSAIQHAKRYKMAMEKTNHTKLVNLAIEETSSAVEKKIDQLTKKPALQPIQQQYQQPPIQHYQVPAQRLIPQNQFTSQNQYQVNNNRINSNNQLDFCHTVLLEGRAAAQQQNSFYISTTIPPARIAENANFSDIFSFEFEANELPFLLSNAVANEQKAITAMYTEAEIPATCGTFNKCSKKALAFEFELEEEKPIIETFMALGSTSNWADKTEQQATKKDVHQMKEAEYIEYTMELAGFNYKDKQMNIRLYEEYIMPCDEQWCPECYALSIPLPSKNDENEIEIGELEATEKIEATSIYLIENQPALQLKYFNNNEQGIKPKKAHEIDAGYDLRYPDKDTLIFKPKSLTKINLKIALEILTGAIVQIASWSSLASKGINVRGGIIDAGYIGDITVILQNETDKPFKIKHAEKIA
ncbi:hypothetical protein G9A89_019208 [Geosiphon pyriformis]|nr:hypothetical protein G9A89_019208 [Geosiphon pyriformis]